MGGKLCRIDFFEKPGVGGDRTSPWQVWSVICGARRTRWADTLRRTPGESIEMPEPRSPSISDGPRFDLDTLEFDAVRRLLTSKLATPLGRTAIEALAPYPSAEMARQAHAEATALAARLDAAAPPLAGVTDPRGWLSPFLAGEHALSSKDLSELRRVLKAALECKAWLAKEPVAEALARFAQGFPDLLDLCQELDMTVDARGEILDTASVRLSELRVEIGVAEAGVQAAVRRFLSDESVHRCLQSPEPAWRHGRPVFGVKQEYHNRVQGILHDRSQSGATVFIEPSVVVEAANRLSDTKAAEIREIQVILAQVARGLQRSCSEIEAAIASLVRLDLAMARARLIAEEGFVAPEIGEGIALRLLQARHPILMSSAHAEELVPLDVALGDPYRLLVITGPNTGGKTVALKTIGLLVIMALCGVPLPAAEGSRVPFVDGVFVDIGDEQAISQNLSTFSSHVTRIVRCLRAATEQSLVLLDELGAGTDPEEGGALGYGVLESLARQGSLAAVTTHLGRLKDFAYQHEGAENGSMTFDGDTLQPLYYLEIGVPGASHALDIAGRVGMPEELVARARELLGERDTRVEETVQKVQEVRRRAEADRKHTAEMNREAERVEEQLREELVATERRQAWLHEEADALVAEELRRIRDEIEKPLGSLLNAPKPYGERAKEVQDALRAASALTRVHRRRMKFVGGLRKDTLVYVPRFRRPCVVKKVDRVREVVSLEVGKLRMEVPFDDISWIQPLDDG